MPRDDASRRATDGDIGEIAGSLWPHNPAPIARLSTTGATCAKLAESYAAAMAANRVGPGQGAAAAAFDILAHALDEDLRASLLKGLRE